MPEYCCGRKVTHIREDGTRLDSMKGVEVPVTAETMPFYHFMERVLKNEIEEERVSK